VTTAQAVEALEVFAELERLVHAGQVLYARRATAGTAWRDEGHRSSAAWMAEKTKTGLGEAIGVLEASDALATLPATTDALRRGELSGSQLKVIAGAAAAHPEAETELLHAAATHSLKGLRESAARIRAAASSAQEENERHAALHRARFLRHYTDTDGALRLDARLTAVDGARLLSCIAVEADARFDEARKAGEPEPPAAYRADALVALVTGTAMSTQSNATAPQATTPRATVCFLVDGTAFTRGFTRNGERCEVAGVGSVPVAAVRRQLPDSFVKILVTRGVDVTTVVHAGRTVPAHLHSALEVRDPTCVVPGCDVAHGLEMHHWEVDYAVCRHTSLTGLARVCHWHHGLLTYGGYALGGGPGAWEMRGPPGGDRFETAEPFGTTQPFELDTG
ncbi:MAG: hypothetical protein ACRDY1_14760, partial [Acidimicrobiales bacterium]